MTPKYQAARLYTVPIVSVALPRPHLELEQRHRLTTLRGIAPKRQLELMIPEEADADAAPRGRARVAEDMGVTAVYNACEDGQASGLAQEVEPEAVVEDEAWGSLRGRMAPIDPGAMARAQRTEIAVRAVWRLPRG